MVRETQLNTVPGGEYLLGDDPNGASRASSAFHSATAYETRGTPGRGSAVLLFLLGLSLIGAGVAMVFAPSYSIEVNRFFSRVGSYGIESGTLVVAGMVIFSMGFVARSVAAVARTRVHISAPVPKRDDSDFMLVADQLATDLAQVLSSLLQMSEEIGALGEGQRSLFEASKAAQESADHGDAQSANFRLAASVDQLGARFDEQLQALGAQSRSRFDAINNALDAARSATESIATRIAEPSPVVAAPAPQVAPAPVAAPVAAAPVAAAPLVEPVASTDSLDLGFGVALAPTTDLDMTAPVQNSEPASSDFLESIAEPSAGPSESLDISDAFAVEEDVQPPISLELKNEALDTLDALLPDDPIRDLERDDLT